MKRAWSQVCASESNTAAEGFFKIIYNDLVTDDLDFKISFRDLRKYNAVVLEHVLVFALQFQPIL